MMREKWVSGKQRRILPLTSFVRSSFLHLPEITKQLSSNAPHMVSQRLDFQRVYVGCICILVVVSAEPHTRDRHAHTPTSSLPAPDETGIPCWGETPLNPAYSEENSFIPA